MSPIVSGSSGGGSGIGAVLFDSTLGGDAASIDTGANGIAQTQNVIEIWVYSRTDEAVALSTIAITLNNDSGANYDRVRVGNTNATVTGTNILAATSWIASTAGASAATSVFGFFSLVIPSYTGTTGQKTASGFSGVSDTAAASNFVHGTVYNYRSTAAISRMKVANGGGTVLKAGSRLLVLGR